jgi:hypothetical protein
VRHRERPGPKTTAATATNGTTNSSIVADWDDQRRRQIRRLATIELTRMLYGPVADLRPTPVGPAVCPPYCGYCWGRRVA